MAVVARFRPAPVTPTWTSMTTVVPPAANTLAKIALPVATATPDPMAFAVMTPPDAAPKAVAEKVNVARSVFPDRPVFAVAGWGPE
jgi:hypothetical protein